MSQPKRDDGSPSAPAVQHQGGVTIRIDDVQILHDDDDDYDHHHHHLQRSTSISSPKRHHHHQQHFYDYHRMTRKKAPSELDNNNSNNTNHDPSFTMTDDVSLVPLATSTSAQLQQQNNKNSTAAVKPPARRLASPASTTQQQQQHQDESPPLPKLPPTNIIDVATAGPDLTAAIQVIGQDATARHYRTRLRFILAFLSIFSFVQVIVCFLLVAPPGLGKMTRNKTADNWPGFPTELGNSAHKPIFLIEGIAQLCISVGAVVVFYFHFASRNHSMGSWCCAPFDDIPRSVRTRFKYFTTAEAFEVLLWLVHCPIGVAFVDERWRYLNGFSVLRLYVIIRAAMELSEFKRLVTRTMLYFFNLKLDAGIFIRYLLEHHKWIVLIPTVMFLWCFLAFCYSLAEVRSFGDSFWFIIVTLSTTGYGEIVPVTSEGRFIGIVTMFVGMIVMAYFVAQVRELTSRHTREQKVIDALTSARLRYDSKKTAAKILLNRYRLRKMLLAPSTKKNLDSNINTSEEGQQQHYHSLLVASSSAANQQIQKEKEKEIHAVRTTCASLTHQLRKTLRELEMKPALFDHRDQLMLNMRDSIERLEEVSAQQSKTINDLTLLLKEHLGNKK